MRQWVSLDLDYITGDCRNMSYDKPSQCARRCPDCQGSKVKGIGRGSHKNSFGNEKGWADDAIKQEEKITCFLSNLQLRRIVVRDCHASILPFLKKGDVVLHVDEHGDFDGWECFKGLYCGNWINYAEGRGVTVCHYEPPMDYDGFLPHWIEFDTNRETDLFVCLSRPYTDRLADAVLGRLLCSEWAMVPVDFNLRR
jgi:hypothetical protein